MSKTQNGSLAATLVGCADGEWITFTPDGLYDASTKGASLLAWRMHGNLVMAADLPHMRVSGLLSKMLSGTALKPPTPLTSVFLGLKWN